MAGSLGRPAHQVGSVQEKVTKHRPQASQGKPGTTSHRDKQILKLNSKYGSNPKQRTQTVSGKLENSVSPRHKRSPNSSSGWAKI